MRSFTSDGYRYGFNGKEKDESGEWGATQTGTDSNGDPIYNSQTHYDYGFRIYNPGIARFLSVDPLAPEYPWYTPYQFAGNKPIRFIDLDGMEEANPSRFTRALNAVLGDWHINRLNAHITGNNLDPETVIQLPNDTYVITQTKEVGGKPITTYSVFRKYRKGRFGFMGSADDDIGLTKDEFLNTEILGNRVLDAPDPVSGSVKGGLKLAGWSSRNVILIIKGGRKQLQQWKKEIKIGINDVTGISGDYISKGAHLHFKKFGNLEASIILDNGKLALKSLSNSSIDDFRKAAKIFSQALNNKQFKESLLINVKAGIEQLDELAKYGIRNVDQVKNKSEELKKVLNVLKEMR